MTRLSTPSPTPRRACPSFVWLFPLAACLATLCLTPPCPADAAPVTLTDDTGHVVELAAPARRIVALYGAFNDMLLDMGLAHRLVARTKADTRPELTALPAIGTHMRPNNELIAALRPDLVLQFEGRREAETQVEQLRALGVPVAVFRGTTFPDVFRIIGALGVLTGAEPRAEALIRSLQTRLEAVAARRAHAARPRVFFEIRSPNLLAAGSGSMAAAIIAAAGGDNAVSLPDRVARLNEEELIRLNPDVYLIQKGPMNPAPLPLAQRPHYRTLQAVRNNRVMEVDESLFSRPAPGAVRAVEQLADFLDKF